MSKKPIIVFEGVEASGKSHHISVIANYLKNKKISFIKLREPGGSRNSEKIRRIILNKKTKFKKETDLLLYLASRSENIDLINKYYNKKIILIDRFVDSTIAYQHYGMGIDKNIIKVVNRFLLKKINVKFTFLNTVSKKNLLLRLKKRKSLNRYDKFKLNFYDKVQKGYLKIAKSNPKSYKIINSNLDQKKNEILIKDQIDKLIK
jgi:dTMP kinase